ncbi:MAG: hypothetical protein U0984_19710, partial [Prosthecobacter sp.]|nr:hypothetical protein [Prosthecobacter sp.]
MNDFAAGCMPRESGIEKRQIPAKTAPGFAIFAVHFQIATYDQPPMPAALPPLTVPFLKKEAAAFSIAESAHSEPSLFGVTDGKAVGTYSEHKFQTDLLN